MDNTMILQKIKAINFDNKSTIALYNEISQIFTDACASKKTDRTERQACYLSMEFLIGRSFYANIFNCDLLTQVDEILKEKGMDIACFEEIEDAALGNGGLGRLAACFLDSGASLAKPLDGYGIRYKNGLFKQAIKNGCQVELPDDWQRFGDPWSIRAESEYQEIEFADMVIKAIPYDVPIIGYGGNCVNNLRLWQAEGNEQCQQISDYLYPDDSTAAGKILRIRQEYFFSLATIKHLASKHFAKYKNFAQFADLHAIQLNDTHPVLAIPALINLLCTQYGVEFLESLEIAKKVFSYTNHTIMEEALECWNEQLLSSILPQVAECIKKINSIAVGQWQALNVPNCDIEKMRFYDGTIFYMARLAVYVCNTVNGVAMLHTTIIKKELFALQNNLYPQKFQNKTNGITPRRWLMLCNPDLSALIDKTIGTSWRQDLDQLKNLKNTSNNILSELFQVKQNNKNKLAKYILKHENIEIDPKSIFYIQVKRLHEYKRQFMSALAILCIYNDLKSGKITNFTPSTFIFGAKSAGSYFRAKGIIKLINEIAIMVNSDAKTNSLLKVVFVSNYNVSYAEKLVSAADVSLQVSTAGLEASGTGNMKFMLSGAVTLGTLDGANVEIVEHAGTENNYIFGATVDQIDLLKKSYSVKSVLKSNPAIKKAVNSLTDGTFPDDGFGYFKELYNSLIKGATWHAPDKYFVLHDLPSYIIRILDVNRDYANRESFTKKSLANIANAGFFSSDRTIKDYCENIWKI